MPESRVLKYNEANIARQKEVQKAHSTQPAKTKKAAAAAKNRKSETVKETDSRASTPSNEIAGNKAGGKNKAPPASSGQDSSSDVPRKKRGRLDPTVESEEQFLNKVEIKVKLPEDMKIWLVDDWDVVTRQRKLVNLPVKVNVDEILENYVNYKKSVKSTNANKESATGEFVNGVREYFNVMLGTGLLYTFERPQYAEILKNHPETPMSKIYGVIHLCRLFVKLGPMLAYTPLDERSIQLLLQNVQDFLKYLVRNSSKYYSLQDYGNAPPEYHRKAL